MPPEVAASIPSSIWSQLAVVLIFSVICYTMIKLFLRGISEINSHYATMIEKINKSWQDYFDARVETAKQIDAQIVEKMARLTIVIE